MTHRGRFITFEGPEGSGKSSQARWLAGALRRGGYHMTVIRDPGSTALGRRLRRALLHTATPRSPMAEALLFIGARVQLVEERIRPALLRRHVVICDRFHDSTVAYQGFGGGLDVRWLDRVGREAIRGVTPTLTVLLDIPTDQGFARLHRSRDRMERKGRAFHRRVRRGYLTLAAREPRRFVVVDASQPAEVVRRQIEEVVRQRLSRAS
jgi:dTMP kinase